MQILVKTCVSENHWVPVSHKCTGIPFRDGVDSGGWSDLAVPSHVHFYPLTVSLGSAASWLQCHISALWEALLETLPHWAFYQFCRCCSCAWQWQDNFACCMVSGQVGLQLVRGFCLFFSVPPPFLCILHLAGRRSCCCDCWQQEIFLAFQARLLPFIFTVWGVGKGSSFKPSCCDVLQSIHAVMKQQWFASPC